jgi:hypothetical protein
MIRKWSYININQLTFSIPALNFQFLELPYAKYKFKIFRKTTRFQKYQLGETKIVRKYPLKLKRRTIYISLAQITFYWLNFFLKTKQIYRFIQNINVFKYTLNLPNIIVFLKKQNQLLSALSYEGYNILTCSKILFNKFIFQYKYMFNYILNHKKFSLLQISDLGKGSKNLNIIGSNLLINNNLYYPYGAISKLKFFYTNLESKNIYWKNILNQVVLIRKLLIQIVLLSSLIKIHSK